MTPTWNELYLHLIIFFFSFWWETPHISLYLSIFTVKTIELQIWGADLLHSEWTPSLASVNDKDKKLLTFDLV